MRSESATAVTRFKVGVFTVLGLLLVGLVTVTVNHHPYWYRPCQAVHIQIEDATGLKMKSPVRSMGIEIGYLKSVALTETHVDLGICITASVEVLPSTRAYIRGEGFLGDKFIELKPVRYVGSDALPQESPGARGSATPTSQVRTVLLREASAFFFGAEAYAADPAPTDPAPVHTRQIPVGESSQDMQAVVNKVDSLVNEMTTLTTNLRQSINPEELRNTMKQLNKTLENASKTLSPDGGLNQTAQRTLAKLEDAVEQLRDMLTRINQGQGSIGMVLNDPTYAEELRKAIVNVNKLLAGVDQVRFVVDIGGNVIGGYNSDRGYFNLQIWPNSGRYFLLGIAHDPRGRESVYDTTTIVGGQTVTSHVTQVEETGILLTAMLGKTFFNDRLDAALGVLYGDGAGSLKVNLGPIEDRRFFQIGGDIYDRGNGIPLDIRTLATLRPLPMFKSVYVDGGLEGFRKVNGKLAWSYGAGLAFDDESIRLLFALLRL